MIKIHNLASLASGTAPFALACALISAPAFAQNPGAPIQPPPGPSDVTGPKSPGSIAKVQQAESSGTSGSAEDEAEEIVVTGTLFKRKIDSETPSPVTVLTADNLAKRGINNVADALHSLSADGAGTLPGAFSANGAFAAGASAISLRGLTTSSTLILFDGLRGASYPLADDGSRSFVDINTIPDAIVERIEVLKDGASSTYGADAIAGVVNIITKKEIQGFSATGEAGISSRGDAAEQRFTLTGGYGELDKQGFNVYLSAEYQRDAQLRNKKRGFPFNTTDLTNMPADDGTPGPNNNQNGQGVAQNNATTSAVVRPATLNDPNNILTGVAIAGQPTMILNPAGCGAGTVFATGDSGDYCQQDTVNQYGVIQPRQTRFGVTAHLTARVGEDAEAYAIATYYQNKVFYISAPEGTFERQPVTIRNIVLPAVLADGTTNPQDPYANIIDPETGQRESALLNYRFGNIPATNTTLTKTYRLATGIHGTFGEGWGYSADATYMHTNLGIKYTGLLDYTALVNAITTGSYNFINPELNSQAELDALSPDVRAKAKSDLWQVQGVITKQVADLAGGPLQVAAGAQIRYEKIDDPVQDPVDANGNYETVGINTFSAVGHRYNEAAFFEVNAPILKELEVDASGRFDHYSEGFSHFSPKLGVKYTPIPQLALRATFSRGFRAPSIPEASGNVIGYTTVTPPENVVQQHCANGTSGDGCVPNGYVKAYGLGQFAVGNPNLKPETSTSLTAGAIIQPTRWLSFTVDYYRIKKKDLIIGGSEFGDAVAAYYAGEELPAGYTVLLNPADPDHPDAIRTVQVVNASYENALSLVTSGLDFAAQAQVHVTDGIQLTSSIEATRVLTYNLKAADGTQKFVGTLGPYAYTSGAGTPKWRGNWQNTFQSGPYTLTATAYYTSGYLGAADDATGAGTASGSRADQIDACAGLSAGANGTSPEQCHVKRFIDVDLSGSFRLNDHITLYTNVLNVFDAAPPFDPAQYSANNYNPAYAEQGIIGRYFRFGANLKF